MTVLVTGARGKVGSRVATLLAAQGVAVRAASRRSDTRLDWTDPAGWDAALDGVRDVFLVVPGGDDGHRNVTGLGPQVIRFLDRAEAHGIESVVLMTALGMEYAPAETELRAVELRVQSGAARWTVLRPNWFYQNLTEGILHELAVAGEGVLSLPVGDARCSLIDAEDIAAVAVAALTEDGHGGREYDLTGPQPLSFAEVAGIASASAALAVRAYRPVTDGQFRESVRALGWDEAYVRQLGELFAMIRAGAAAEVSPHAGEILRRPPRTLREFVRHPH